MGKIGTPRYKNELGKKYGKLTVINFVKTNKQTAFWECICECGTKKVVNANSLRSGHSNSCGVCAIEIVNEESVFKRRWRSIKSGAKSRNLIVNISYEIFKATAIQDCFYCGAPPEDSWVTSRRKDSTGKAIKIYAKLNGLDRLDPSKGYEESNIVPCCFQCNRMKTNLTLESFYKRIKDIYDRIPEIGNDTKN